MGINQNLIIGGSGLDQGLICGICSGLLENAIVLKSCQHYFCHDCINLHIGSGNAQCPEKGFLIEILISYNNFSLQYFNF